VRLAPSIGATHAILADHQAELTPRAYGLLLSTLRKEKDWRASARTVSWASKNDASKLNAQHFTLAISACARSRQWRAALDLLRLAGSAADVVCFNAALAACASAGRGREALQLLEKEMPRAGVVADAYSYSAVFGALGRAGKGQQVLGLLERMRRRQLAPSLVGYTAAMAALQRCGRWRDALALFDELEGEGVELDVVAYGAALAAARSGGDAPRCIALTEQMLTEGLTPSAYCVNELMQACVGTEAWEGSLALARDAGHLQTGVDFNVALDACHGTPAGSRMFLDALAAGAYRKLANPSRRWTLDLHGLSGGAARQAVEWWLTDVQSPLMRVLRARPHETHDGRPQTLTIITGSGRHRQRWQRSATMPSTSVRSSVQSLLEEARAPLQPSSNDGVLELSLHPHADWGVFGEWVDQLGAYRAAEFTHAAATPPLPPLVGPWADPEAALGHHEAEAAHEPTHALAYGELLVDDDGELLMGVGGFAQDEADGADGAGTPALRLVGPWADPVRACGGGGQDAE